MPPITSIDLVFVIGKKIPEEIKRASWCDLEVCGHLIYVWYADCFWRRPYSNFRHLVDTALRVSYVPYELWEVA